MKRLFIILFLLIFLIGCTTLRYGDDLTAPYSQTEIEITGAGTIIVTALGILTAGIMHSEMSNP